MSYLDAILLGLIQGLTEFLPISSSGHLVLAQEIIGVKQPGLTFELMAHLGTLFAVLVYFRKKILLLITSLYKAELKAERKIILYLIIGTIPAGLVGLMLDDFFEEAFSSPRTVALMLIVTGLILLSTRFVAKGNKDTDWKNSLLMGIGQAFAIMPGISRSGSTIAVGLLSKVKPETAAEFSFLLAVPAIAGAVVLKSDELIALNRSLLGPTLIGTVVSFVSGLFAVYLLLAIIRKGRFDYFAYYCFTAGLIGLYLFR